MNFNLIDTHAHLNFPDFQNDLDQVVQRSLWEGVTKIICVSSNLADSKKAIEIAKKYPRVVYATVGIHPQQTDPGNFIPLKKQIAALENLAKKPEVIAIGECGLDYFQMEDEKIKKVQQELFKIQIEIAHQLNLPLVIHNREAHQDTVKILLYYTSVLNLPLRGVFHCFSGDKEFLHTILGFGFYVGFDGNITFKNARGLQEIAKITPLEKVVLETDSPFLSPDPCRGLRNEPKNVKIIAEFLVKLEGVSFKKTAQITSQNAKTLFKI